jgi:hypothetical protein
MTVMLTTVISCQDLKETIFVTNFSATYHTWILFIYG